MGSPSDLTVSLESHLLDALTPLVPILPPNLRERLSADLTRSEVRYSILSELSQWSRSEDGTAALKSIDLDPLSYTMVSLLAGTRTSPSKSFPKYTPPESAAEAAQREWSDRKALTTIVNSILCVVCSGGAAWWAADKSGWKDEWKVLLALAIAAIVAFSEAALYVIWQSRDSSRKPVDTVVKLTPNAKSKRREVAEAKLSPQPREDETAALASKSVDSDVKLRHRKAVLTLDGDE